MDTIGKEITDDTKEIKVDLVLLNYDDYLELNAVMRLAYHEMDEDLWREKDIKKLIRIFPEGQLCVKVNNKVAAVALAIVVDYQKFGDNHSYEDITGKYTFNTHNPKGDVLYGIEVFVKPEFRDMRLARRLYGARKEICEQLNLRAIMAGGRIPNYEKFSAELTPRQYIEKVKSKEIYDPALSFQLSNDFHVKKILKNYLESDNQSKEYATLLEWNNIYYQENKPTLGSSRTNVRIGLVQWQMRFFESLTALMDQVEYFVDAVSDYKSDFVLFPELFNAPLMVEFNHLTSAEAIRGLATYTDAIKNRFQELAVSYNVNIITGSMPYVNDEGKLLNVSFLCRRNGTWERYCKIHATPSEVRTWGMSGGHKIQTFDTDCGKIGILICYDVEFPELSRIYAEQGVQILFVPFMTDTQNGYNRVRCCAQARAIENECYVAIAGCVGNLPKIRNMDIQYAQSAIFTPSDFAFPMIPIKAEATPNTEMTIIADLDLDLLKELHEEGSVQNLKDRRKDLYQLKLKPTKKD